MKQITLPVQASSPLAIRSDHSPDGSATARFIPGSTLMGSLAAAHRLLRSERTDEFAALFLQERVSYPVLSPALFKNSSYGIHTSNLPVMPLPRTAQSCKRFPGFGVLRGEDSTEARHGIRDSLLDWSVFSLLARENSTISTLLAPLEEHEACHCHQTLAHVSGYYRRDRHHPELRMKAESHTHWQTHTGINRDWGVVEEGILYSREVFDEDMRFWGQVLLPEDEQLGVTFKTFVEEANKEGILRIGTGRTRGLGCIEIPKLIEEEKPEREQFAERLRKFDDKVKEKVQAIQAQKSANDFQFYFAITLYSPAILCDAFLRYRTTLDTETLTGLLQHPSAVITAIYQSVSIERITGWNELWGTPRPNDYALETGSTFLFASSQPLDNQMVHALFALEETGIGRRRPEGFGRICISDPFHLEGALL